MCYIRRVLGFWRRVLQVLIPLCGFLILLEILIFLLREIALPPWQVGVKLVVGATAIPLAIGLAFAFCIRYMQALYDIEGKREPFWHVVHCLFGQANFRPWALYQEGKLGTELTKPDAFIVSVGGPGNLVIRKDTAVILEQGGRLTRVEGPGFPHLERFERVYDVQDLRPQRWQYPVKGMSKEGIPVTCETDINFQLQDGGQQPSGDNPYPTDLEQVFKASTSKWIREDNRREGDRALDWKGRIVVSATEGTLRFILARYPLDRLVGLDTKSRQHPREQIRGELEKNLGEFAKEVGAKMLKVELGQIEVDGEIDQQWVEGWRAEWERWGTEYIASAEDDYVGLVGAATSEAVAKRIVNTANILYNLRQEGEEAFITGAKLQLSLALRNIDSDSLALTYLPAEAMKLLANTTNFEASLPPPQPQQPQQPPPAGPQGTAPQKDQP